YAGAHLAFGQYADAQLRIDQAEVILSLDADFLACGAGSLRHARDFASRRRPEQPERMNRLYAVETMPTATGSRADHRLPLRRDEIREFAYRVASGLNVAGLAPMSGLTVSNATTERWLTA